MTSSNLQGCKILLLRQAADNRDLLQQIEKLQGTTVAWSALQIIGNNKLNFQHTQNQVEATESCIFISKNAVAHARPWVETIKQKIVIAIGKATKHSLNNIGVNNVVCPISADTEGLLKLSELLQVNKHKIIIFKGCKGREKLQTVLSARGAIVESVDLYQRLDVEMTLQHAKQITEFSPNWIQLTSEASAVSLDKANQRFKLFNKREINILTVSKRLKQKLSLMGYVQIFTAKSIYIKDNIQALQSAYLEQQK